jgi:hypothetical protein
MAPKEQSEVKIEKSGVMTIDDESSEIEMF